MKSLDFNLDQLVASYTPRQTGVSLVLAYRFTGLLPSIIQRKISISQLGQNPDFTLISSGKNNNILFKDIIYKYLKVATQVWKLEIRDNYIYQRPTFILNNPQWAKTSQEDYNFNKLYQSKEILVKLFYLPFVSQIYICGSQALEQSWEFSDVDLIIRVKPCFGLSNVTITRFWIKVYLKIINRDVHPFLIHYLWLFCKKIKSKKIEKILETKYLNFKKSPRIRLDIGLIIDQRLELEYYTRRDIDRLGYLVKKRVLLQDDISANLDSINCLYLNQIKYRYFKPVKIVTSIIELLSLIFYPLFLIQYFWFWLFNRQDINQFCNYYIWHSFTKVGFKNSRISRLRGEKVYLYH